MAGHINVTNTSVSPVARAWLAVRSLFWTIVFPGFFAGYLPWRFFGLRSVAVDFRIPLHWAGLFLICLGAALLVACIFEFARSGRGTLSPVDPPSVLVVRGLYRYVRNPMYLSVTLIVWGEILLTQSAAMFGYWIVWFTAANLFVLGYEEPALRRQFGSDYDRYASTVGRWFPKSRALKPTR
jgi:protein-S-isoprenylcysteine O-methyltransferase Ste14